MKSNAIENSQAVNVNSHLQHPQVQPKPKRSFGLKNGKKIFEGYNDEKKVKNRKAKEKQRAGYHAFSKDFSKENLEFPTKYLDKTIQSSPLSILNKLPDNCIDLLITSLPLCELSKNHKKTKKEIEKYLHNLSDILIESIRTLKYGGRLIIGVNPQSVENIPVHHLVSKLLFDKGLIWKTEILWDLSEIEPEKMPSEFVNSWRTGALRHNWKFLEIYCKGSLKKEGARENIDINDEEFKKWVNSRWQIKPNNQFIDNKGNDNKSNQFPQELIERLLKLLSFRGDVIFDPFDTSGISVNLIKKHHRHLLNIKKP